MTQIKFCDCLKLLLSALSISSNRLSRAINVDNSLVNRWINGKRIPPYNSAYINKIAEFIAKNIYNTYQRQRINSIMAEVCGISDHTLDIKDQLEHMLLEAQGYSMECAQKDRGEIKYKPGTEKIRTKKLPVHYPDPPLSEIGSSSLSSNDKVLLNSHSILLTVLSMLEKLSVVKPEKDHNIYISLSDYRFLDHYPEKELDHWLNTLLMALHNGWTLVLLIKLVHDNNQLIRLIDMIKPLIFTGKVYPYFMKKYESYVIGDSLMILPGIGVLVPFTHHQDIPCGNALYLTNQHAVHMYLSHFKHMIDKSAKLLVKRYSGNIDYSQQLIRIEEYAGDRFLYRSSFGMLTIPEPLYLRLLKRIGVSELEAERSLKLYQMRYAAFLSHIHHYQYCDIYLSSSMEDLLNEHILNFYSYYGVDRISVELIDIIEHLEHIIELLETYANYHIAFLNCDTEIDKNNKNIYCLIKDRHSILFEIINTKKNVPDIRISSDEPMIVNAFYEYFKNLWELIPPINKNKAEVIHWLRTELTILWRMLHSD